MDENFRKKVRHLYRVNRILWTGVFAGVLTLIGLGYLFHQMNTMAVQPGAIGPQTDTIILFLAIGLLYIVFHMKRTYLAPDRLIKRAQTKTLQITSVDLEDFIAEFGNEANVMAKTLILLRRYYMVIWSIANLITLLGFIQFVISGEIKVLMIYGVVSLYSLLINFPSFRIIEQCYTKISQD